MDDRDDVELMCMREKRQKPIAITYNNTIHLKESYWFITKTKMLQHKIQEKLTYLPAINIHIWQHGSVFDVIAYSKQLTHYTNYQPSTHKPHHPSYI